MTAGNEHIDAIDGLRAVAVLAVLLFHADLGVAPGGFLGVSVFFTLSGYLITSLLLREHATDGTISIRRFYVRRWRRLIPSAWVCIAAVLAAWLLWSASQLRALPGDALAALGNVANWRFAFATTSYQDLFIGQPSPLAHFWSLAIEEQFYAVMPLIALLCLRRSRRTLSLVAGAMLLASVAANILTNDQNLVYNGTHTRAAELLVGVLLALHAPQIGRLARACVGWSALGVFGVLVATTSVSDAWLYNGGLPLFALASAGLVVAVIGPRGSGLTTLMATRPLVAIGHWSYALYLLHWPIYLALSPQRTGLSPWPLLALRATIALAAAVLITTIIERPIRARRIIVGGHRGAITSLIAAAALVAACVALPAPTFSDNEELLAAGNDGRIVFDDSQPGTEPGPIVPRQVLVVGSGVTVPQLLRDHGLDVIDATDVNCPLTPAAEVQLSTSLVVDTSACGDPVPAWLETAAAVNVVDVVVALGGVDEGVVRDRTEVGFPDATDYAGVSARWLHFAVALNRLWDRVPSTVNVQLVRVGDVDATLQYELTRFAASRSALPNVHFTLDSVIESLQVTSGATDQQLRVLVVGDSTSVILAAALYRADPGRVDVEWVGANGCPVVPVVALRSTASEPWQQVDCPANTRLVGEQLATFRPDVVVLMVSAGELLHQQYNGDGGDHIAGDREFTAVHDDFMRILSALLNDYDNGHGVPLLVADCPQLVTSGFVKDETASRERIAAWNAQVHRWVDSSSSVGLLPYASAINDRQRLNTQEHVLVDGIHADVDILIELVRTRLLDVIEAAAAG